MSTSTLRKFPTFHDSPFQEKSSISVLARSLKAIPFALIATLALFFSMYTLIKNDAEYIEPPTETPKIIDFIMKKIPPIENDYTRPVKPTDPDVEPPKPALEFEPVNTKSGAVIHERMKPVVPPVDTNIYSGDQLMALIKVQPSYPTTAAARGIEGFVDVVFDVTVLGTTENIRIAYAEPSSIFNRSVIQAIQRWKYKPKVVEGKAVIAFDVRERITFEFDQ